jgi:hypothetical protein
MNMFEGLPAEREERKPVGDPRSNGDRRVRGKIGKLVGHLLEPKDAWPTAPEGLGSDAHSLTGVSSN